MMKKSVVKRFFSCPLVRTSLYVLGGAFIGLIGGLLLALFAAGVSWLMFRSLGAVDFATIYATYAGMAMLFGGLSSGVLAGVAAVRTQDDGMFMMGCGDDCDGCACCEGEEEVVAMGDSEAKM